MIEVKVRLYGKLQECVAEVGVGEVIVLSLPENSRISALLTRLGLPEEKVNLTFVNHRQQDDKYQLRDGDRVGIFPLVAGG